jgi:hypothetical protein
MLEAFRTLRRAARLFWGDLSLFFLLNLLTTLSLFLVVPFPPAIAGLCYVARRAAEGRFVRFGDWVEGLRRYFWKAWGVALINLLVVALTVYNIGFYGPGGNFPWSGPAWVPAAIQGTLVAFLAFWAGWQMFLFPLMVEEEQPRLLGLMGRSLLIMVRHPVFSVTVLLLIALLTVVSTVAFGVGFFVTPGAVAALTVVAARHLTGKDVAAP